MSFALCTYTSRSVILLCALLVTAPWTSAAADRLQILFPKHRLHADELALIVNDEDPLSVQIGDYYRRARGIPERNVLHLRFQPGRSDMTPQEFRRVREILDRDTPPGIQAYAITWAAPYRVTCMSITSAIGLGFDKAWCSSRRCAPTRRSPYFASGSAAPWHDHGVRPTMAIAAASFDEARALIDRGVRSDNTQPEGTAYLVSTADKARNVRASAFAAIARHQRNWLDTEIVEAEALKDAEDVLFYFTGKLRVPYLDTLRFVPGAAADHVTSAGGRLTDSRQMSALRWLEAGATGSYGTVVEPCNVRGKFPDPGVLMESYTSGRTLLEAYWQSVQQPGEGIFIGEPLAAPWDGYDLQHDDDHLLLNTRVLRPGAYAISWSRQPVGPYRPLPDVLRVAQHQRRFMLPMVEGARYLRLQRR
ncbi:MAG: TIGR03790 family protein [Gammaproteobacteria bacterium]